MARREVAVLDDAEAAAFSAKIGNSLAPDSAVYLYPRKSSAGWIWVVWDHTMKAIAKGEYPERDLKDASMDALSELWRHHNG